MRPSWDRYFMAFARVASTRSTCPRRHVGAVVVVNNHVVGTGYNGSPAHKPHCDDVGCLMVDGHCVRTVHAEVNALRHSAILDDPFTLYTTASPCLNCAEHLVADGCARVVYRDAYPAPEALEYLRSAGVQVERIGR